jgi:hypothetical protein
MTIARVFVADRRPVCIGPAPASESSLRPETMHDSLRRLEEEALA